MVPALRLRACVRPHIDGRTVSAIVVADATSPDYVDRGSAANRPAQPADVRLDGAAQIASDTLRCLR